MDGKTPTYLGQPIYIMEMAAWSWPAQPSWILFIYIHSLLSVKRCIFISTPPPRMYGSVIFLNRMFIKYVHNSTDIHSMFLALSQSYNSPQQYTHTPLRTLLFSILMPPVKVLPGYQKPLQRNLAQTLQSWNVGAWSLQNRWGIWLPNFE